MIHLSYHKSSLFCMAVVIWVLFATSAAYGVMPPEHYEYQARQSKIKAIAQVQSVKGLSTTQYQTRKLVVFDLIKAFEKNIPNRFSGICYSADQVGQHPLPGGTLYYYPVTGQKVLVTISADSGMVTSYTPLDPALENELEKRALKHIKFKMGKAIINKKMEKWYLFYLDDKLSGYLSMTILRDKNISGTAVLKQSFMVAETNRDRTHFNIQTRFRDTTEYIPEWISIESTLFSDGPPHVHPIREYGFRPSETSLTESGILLKGNGAPYDISVSHKTTTDFLLFLGVENIPLEKEAAIQIDLLETLELHYKKKIEIRFKGRDKFKNHMYRFDQTGSAKASYWLDDNHELIEVMWDIDKRFVKSEESQIIKFFH